MNILCFLLNFQIINLHNLSVNCPLHKFLILIALLTTEHVFPCVEHFYEKLLKTTEARLLWYSSYFEWVAILNDLLNKALSEAALLG